MIDVPITVQLSHRQTDTINTGLNALKTPKYTQCSWSKIIKVEKLTLKV